MLILRRIVLVPHVLEQQRHPGPVGRSRRAHDAVDHDYLGNHPFS